MLDLKIYKMKYSKVLSTILRNRNGANKDYIGRKCVLIRDSNRYKWENEVSASFTLHELVEIKNNSHDIFSVMRISDGQIFKIGDTLANYKVIIGFEIAEEYDDVRIKFADGTGLLVKFSMKYTVIHNHLTNPCVEIPLPKYMQMPHLSNHKLLLLCQ